MYVCFGKTIQCSHQFVYSITYGCRLQPGKIKKKMSTCCMLKIEGKNRRVYSRAYTRLKAGRRLTQTFVFVSDYTCEPPFPPTPIFRGALHQGALSFLPLSFLPFRTRNKHDKRTAGSTKRAAPPLPSPPPDVHMKAFRFGDPLESMTRTRSESTRRPVVQRQFRGNANVAVGSREYSIN